MILGTNLAPTDGEEVVKYYHTTGFKSWLLGIRSDGYIEVTNKRVIFQAISANSLMHSEVPISDVSGISIFKGTYFNLWRLLLGILLGLVTLSFMSGIFVVVLNGLTNDSDASEALSWIMFLGMIIGSWFIRSELIWRPLLAAAATSMLVSILGGGLLDAMLGGRGSAGLAGLLLLPTLIYVLFTIFMYARRPTMALSINSKGGSSTPISIAGASVGGALGSSAARALDAEPGPDAANLARELGAMIMDIQQFGDLGIGKWRA